MYMYKRACGGDDPDLQSQNDMVPHENDTVGAVKREGPKSVRLAVSPV